MNHSRFYARFVAETEQTKNQARRHNNVLIGVAGVMPTAPGASKVTMAEFDYIIVGAGSAGCTLANRLSRNWRVLLIEGGGERTSGVARRPSDYIKLFGSADDWGWKTSPQAGLAGRQLLFPRGRGLGGSSRINASIWIEPHTACLDRLARETNHNYSRTQLQSAYNTVESLVAPEEPRWLSQSTKRFLRAAEEVENRQSMKLDATPFRRMNHRGVRRTAADLFLDSCDDERSGFPSFKRAKATSSLTILSNYLVHRLEIQDNSIVGVVCRGHRGEQLWTAEIGVILSAGAVASPAILQRSGIGNRRRLRKVGIECRIPLDEVGQGLRDHLIFPSIFQTPKTACFPLAWSPSQLARWRTVGRGPVASNLAEAGLFHGQGAEKLQLHVTPTDYLRHPTSPKSAMTIAVSVAHPRSSGEVHVVSSDPDTSPIIDPRYLSNPEDFALLRGGLDLVRELVQTEPLADWLGDEVVPGKRDWKKSIERFSQTLYHPVGGCCLGKVVDADFRVHRTENLWVVDASTLPFIPAANPNPLIMTLAWAVADRLAAR